MPANVISQKRALMIAIIIIIIIIIVIIVVVIKIYCDLLRPLLSSE
jgi:hypothetical protein